jgi:hypothetical protein
MTKQVRIENADTSDHKIIVQMWNKGVDGAPDNMVDEVPLNHPTALTTQTIWKERYLVIKEV